MGAYFIRTLRHFAFCVRDMFHPRAIRWRWLQKHHPRKSVITRLGKNLKVRIHPYDTIGKAIYVNRVFEMAESKFVTRFLKPGMVFFDAGANFGQYTLLAANCVGPNGTVHSFEPNTRMFTELRFNVELNGLTDVCTLNNLAIANTQGTAKLSQYEPGSEVYCSLGTHQRGKSPIIGNEEVKTTTFDAYISNKGLPHIDLIKMDIEGAELLALQGGENLLSQKKAPVIVLEISQKNASGFGYTVQHIWDFLEQLGYSIYNFNRRGRICGLAEPPSLNSNREDYVAFKEVHIQNACCL